MSYNQVQSLQHYTLSPPQSYQEMRTYLELEEKLGTKSKIQSQQNQSRPTQPITNPPVRSQTKATDKRRKLIPTKRYKVQVVAKPESIPNASNMIMQISTTAPSTTMKIEKGNPFQEVHQATTSTA